MRTADGKAWRVQTLDELWISRRGECRRQPPPDALAGGWRLERAQVWASSDGDVCLGWPSKVLQEQQRGAASGPLSACAYSAPARAGGAGQLRCADPADALAAIRQARGRAGPDGANARAVDGVLREALLRQAERVAVERRGGGSPDALLLTRADLLGPCAGGG
jgi:hypothetical protein